MPEVDVFARYTERRGQRRLHRREPNVFGSDTHESSPRGLFNPPVLDEVRGPQVDRCFHEITPCRDRSLRRNR